MEVLMGRRVGGVERPCGQPPHGSLVLEGSPATAAASAAAIAAAGGKGAAAAPAHMRYHAARRRSRHRR
eukprot:15432246-Alexandrium_andersonii.AAC.1